MWQYFPTDHKWSLLCLYLVVLAIKIQVASAKQLPWLVVFIPLLCHHAINAGHKYRESKGYLVSSIVESRPIVIRQFACTIDQFGNILGSFCLCIFLQIYDTGNHNMDLQKIFEKYYFISLLLVSVICVPSTIMRLSLLVMMKERMSKSFLLKSSIRPSGFNYIIINMLPKIIVRGAIPLLFIFRLNGYIRDWIVVFTPFWFFLFLGFALGVLLILRAPLAHTEDSVDLRTQAAQLIYITAAHILVFSLGLLITLVWLTQWLQNNNNFSNSNTNHNFNFKNSSNNSNSVSSIEDIKNVFPALVLITPMLFVFILFSFMQPKLLERSKAYQVHVLYVRIFIIFIL